MEVIRGIHNIQPQHQGCVLTIGNFDGVHCGHQALLKKLVAKSKELNLPALVMIFEPQPNEFFFPDKKIPRLMRLREKIEALREQGVDRVLVVKFDNSLAIQLAENFVRIILVEKLAVKYILVGDDFHFGYKRLGNFALLEELGDKYHFKTDCVETFTLDTERISSTRIRQLLEQGDLEAAKNLLGQYFCMTGKIAHGDARGRLLGCPTANIHLHRKFIPVRGVFAVQVFGIDKDPIPGVANVGTRPTLSGDARTLLEVHLLNFNQFIYGKRVKVEFLYKFRDEKKFADLEELKMQILEDIKKAKEFHANFYQDK